MKKLISAAVAIFVSVSLMAQTSADLKLNLAKNKTYRVASTMKQNTSVTYGGASQQVETTSKTTLSVTPFTVTADFIEADVRFDTIITKNSMPKLDISSLKKGSLSSSDASEVMSVFFNRLSNATFKVKFSLTGSVLEIENMKSVLDEVTKGIDSLQGPMATLKSQIGNVLGEAAIKGMIETITAGLPGKSVKVGEKWDSKISLSSGGIGMVITNSNKLKKITGNLAEIAAESVIEPSSQAPVEMNGAQITYDVRGLGKTTMIVDTQTGWIVKSTLKQHNQGNMGIKAQGNDMQMPLEVDSSTENIAIQ